MVKQSANERDGFSQPQRRFRRWQLDSLFAVFVVLAWGLGVAAQATGGPTQGLSPAGTSVQATSHDKLDPVELVRRALANKDKREPQLANYTYFERERGFDEFSPSSCDTYEIMLIAGRPYRRHVAHDDRPLPPQEQLDEESKLKQERDRRMTVEGLKEEAMHGHNQLSPSAVYVENELRLPLRQIPEWFVVRITGEELVDDRKNYVLEATPQVQHKATTEEDQNAQDLSFKLWIDEADIQITRVEGRVIGSGFANTKQRIWTASPYPGIPQRALEEAQEKQDKSLRAVYLAGTVFTEEWRKVNEEVWLPYFVTAEGRARNVSVFGKTKPRKVDRSRTYYGYQKFRADTRILPQ